MLLGIATYPEHVWAWHVPIVQTLMTGASTAHEPPPFCGGHAFCAALKADWYAPSALAAMAALSGGGQKPHNSPK